jgi:signal transduction histidine kinase/ActR/RegA family two-component response regulator
MKSSTGAKIDFEIAVRGRRTVQRAAALAILGLLTVVTISAFIWSAYSQVTSAQTLREVTSKDLGEIDASIDRIVARAIGELKEFDDVPDPAAAPTVSLREEFAQLLGKHRDLPIDEDLNSHLEDLGSSLARLDAARVRAVAIAGAERRNRKRTELFKNELDLAVTELRSAIASAQGIRRIERAMATKRFGAAVDEREAVAIARSYFESVDGAASLTTIADDAAELTTLVEAIYGCSSNERLIDLEVNRARPVLGRLDGAVTRLSVGERSFGEKLRTSFEALRYRIVCADSEEPEAKDAENVLCRLIEKRFSLLIDRSAIERELEKCLDDVRLARGYVDRHVADLNHAYATTAQRSIESAFMRAVIVSTLAALFLVVVATLVVGDVRSNIRTLIGLHDDLDRAMVAAESGLRAKSEFLATMSHELRTPLNGILGVGYLLDETDLDPVQRDHVAVLRSSGEHLITIINDILDIAKVDAGKLSLEKVDVRPAELVRDIRMMFEPKAKSTGTELGVEIDPSVPEIIRGDPTRLRQVVLNLLGNAVKFTEHGKVEVKLDVFRESEGAEDASVEPNRLRIAVQDSGIGMTPETVGRLFEPFMQADSSTTRRFGGTGLGLSITHKLIELMGGTIVVVSRPGGGSCFTCVIPFEAAVKPRPTPSISAPTALPAIPVPASKSAEESTRRLRILIVDDNPINRKVGMASLARMDLDIVPAEDGKEAVVAFDRSNFDMILMDCQMPEMDGFEATRLIRKIEAEKLLPHTPIVAITANALSGEDQHCRDAGMDDYIAKPFKPDDLRRMVEHWTKK